MAAHMDKRTIPTGVGKTTALVSAVPHAADHPHGRGENSTFSKRSLRAFGPSPRAWGKHDIQPEKPTTFRTIPTGVGKTHFPRFPGQQTPDHPHGRGENSIHACARIFINGPSPRAWGKHLSAVKFGFLFRTIPTGVGKTRMDNITFCMVADHPHGRGENELITCLVEGVIGPSPRAWGKLQQIGEDTCSTYYMLW